MGFTYRHSAAPADVIFTEGVFEAIPADRAAILTLHACTIGDKFLVGMGSVVLDGVVTEDFVMIGAGSVVPPGKRLEARGLYVGSPARRVRDLTRAESTSSRTRPRSSAAEERLLRAERLRSPRQ